MGSSDILTDDQNHSVFAHFRSSVKISEDLNGVVRPAMMEALAARAAIERLPLSPAARLTGAPPSRRLARATLE